ncbi:phosphatidylserine decarboxylase [Desulfitispora alkaliphila]|uniref:phosphatidylserine decarboxylase n=1 Tax=Desulfitispora alkaliphila TaxID=622674 RepID=UPI003D250A23
MEIVFIDRRTGKKIKEVVSGEKLLRWAHETKTGGTLIEYLVKKKFINSYYGKFQNLPSSKKKIKNFVQELSIDMSEAERENLNDYESFNDFFARKLKDQARPICKDSDCVISPADGRLLAYENIDMNNVVQIKGSHYNLNELFQDEKLALEYDKGVCIVIRLNPADYHRFHFPDSGIPQESKSIKGNYYSVNPIALKKVAKIYCQNKREFTQFQSDNFGKIVLVEVGATCVGTIIQTYEANKKVFKGQEKGYFKFGGSTVIMFFKENTIKVDEDLIKNTEEGFETKVNMGERIAKAK